MKIIVMISMLFSLTSFTKESGLDLSKSLVKWKGTKVTGEHVGTMKFKNADLKLKDGKLVSGTLNIDLSSINTTDLEGKWKKKFETHIKSEDFFNVEKYPVATLKIKKVEKGNLVGELQIKDKKGDVKIPFKKNGKTYEGKFKFDRTKYGMVYKSKNFFKNLGDKVIHDTVEVSFKAVLK